MTQCIPMRTTEPPSSAPQLAPRGRLHGRQEFRLEATGISAKGSARRPAGGANLFPMTVLAGLLGLSAVIRSVKSP